jgi:large subunit ribosomal protein L32
MAVPKKRTSRSKKNSRRATWISKANIQAQKAFSLANSVLKGKSSSFIYSLETSEKEQTTE